MVLYHRYFTCAFLWANYTCIYSFLSMRISFVWFSNLSGHICLSSWVSSSMVLNISHMLIKKVSSSMVQLAVECIFCSACIRFVECCPQEGLTGRFTDSADLPFSRELIHCYLSLTCFPNCREALDWSWKFCIRLANKCRQVGYKAGS